MPKLTLPPEYGKGRWFLFEQSVLVGRGRGVNLSIKHPSVSRRHARIVRTEDRYAVVDLQSANGTFLNGRPVLTTLLLQDGDRLSFGAVDVVYSTAHPSAKRSGEVTPEELGSQTGGETPTAGYGLPRRSAHDTDAPGHLGPATAFFFKLAQITAADFDLDGLMAFVIAEMFRLVPRAARAAILTPNAGTARRRVRIARTRFGKAADFNPEDVVDSHSSADPRTSAVHRSAAKPAEASICTINGRQTIIVPLVFDRRSFGVLVVDDGGLSTPLRRADLHLLRALAQPVAQAMAYAWLRGKRHQQSMLEHDLELARKIQQHFLPARPPDIDGFDLTVTYLPALGVGGDFYDFLPLDPSRIGFVIGDVSGKGLSAALYAARISSDLRYLAPQEADPAAILTELDQRVTSLAQDGMFVTAALGILDARTGRLSVASAGHPLPLVRRADGTLQPIGLRGGMPLGVGRTKPYASQRYDLQPGETLILYTDGVVDAANGQGSPFGFERFSATIRRSDPTAAGLQQQLLGELNDFVGDRPRFDDIIVICVSRRTGSLRRQSSAGARSSSIR